MAKRAVRRERRRTGQEAAPAASPPPPAAPPWRTRAFWLGGALVGSVVAVVAVAVLLATGGSDDPQPAAAVEAAATPEVLEGKTEEELAAEFRQRDREQIESLTAGARRTAGAVAPVVAEFNKALPSEGGGEQADAGTIDDWIAIVRERAEPLRETVSGETATNVARASLSSSLDSLLGALETYRLAAESGGDREALQKRAATQRDLAIKAWSTASTQLDYVNIVAGFGHQHVAQIGGGLPPDTLPEGTDAHPPSE